MRKLAVSLFVLIGLVVFISCSSCDEENKKPDPEKVETEEIIQRSTGAGVLD
jgi:hypothetical protein